MRRSGVRSSSAPPTLNVVYRFHAASRRTPAHRPLAVFLPLFQNAQQGHGGRHGRPRAPERRARGARAALPRGAADLETVLPRKHHVEHDEVERPLQGPPPGGLSDLVSGAVAKATNRQPVLSTTGGTSDGRLIAPTGAQVLELGPVNESIHKIDEHVRIEDIERLTSIYEGIMERLLT